MTFSHCVQLENDLEVVKSASNEKDSAIAMLRQDIAQLRHQVEWI